MNKIQKAIKELKEKYPVENLQCLSDGSWTFGTYFFGPISTDHPMSYDSDTQCKQRNPFCKMLFKAQLTLTPDFPARNPSVGVQPRAIFHPNIDCASGSVCVNFLKTDWDTRYTLTDVLETILPSLLLQPNPADPQDLQAAEIYNKNFPEYIKKASKTAQKWCIKSDQAIAITAPEYFKKKLAEYGLDKPTPQEPKVVQKTKWQVDLKDDEL